MLLLLLVFALFWLGHACLWMWLLNVTYSQPIHRDILKKLRLFFGAMIWFGPPALGLLLTFDLVAVVGAAWNAGSYVPYALWVLSCLIAAVLLLPLVTIRRLLRKPPAAVVAETTETIDIEKQLGHRPVGDGKFRKLAAKEWNQLFRVDFTTLTLALPDLPRSWDGLTILHLSDLHFIGTPAREYYEWVFAKCMADGVPDVLALTGDIIDTDRHHRWIVPLLGRLRWKEAAFAILGNHDYWYDTNKVRRRLRRLGMHEVGNRWERVTLRGEPLTVIGHEGPWFRPAPDLANCTSGDFRICLSHTPDNMKWCRRHGVRLMLSGHNHGGQIRVPIFGSIFVPSKYGRRYDMGTFFESPTLLHVNRGLAGKEALRFRCNPQVTRIVLRCHTST